MILLIVLLLVTSACTRKISDHPAPSPEPPPISFGETYTVDPLFADFYEILGGVAVLGPALTPLIDGDSVKSQYVEAGLMVFDPFAPESEQYRLADLGVSLGISDHGVPKPDRPGVRYANGHIIYKDFIPLYEKLGGARFVGLPLTEARHNPEKGRFEQYFANLGFYRLDQEPGAEVHLLAYGAYACDLRCRFQPRPSEIPSVKGFLPEPFASQAAALGVDFLGRTLTEPHPDEDGNQEVIFENLVLVVNSEQLKEKAQYPYRVLIPQALSGNQVGTKGASLPPIFDLWIPLVLQAQESIFELPLPKPRFAIQPALGSNRAGADDSIVKIKPIVQLLGIDPQTPSEPDGDPLMVFYPTVGEKGFNVPVYFDTYIRQHGGVDVTGEPITEVFAKGEGIYRQCFENICLDFDSSAAEDEQLKPAPLGALYKARFYQQNKNEIGSLENVDMEVWEGAAYVGPEESQEIHVLLQEGKSPLKNREPIISLILPDNSQQTYTFSPTNAQGESVITVPPIEALNGTIIQYTVCLIIPKGESLCKEGDYLIWNYPE